jgi:hypothetical protein
MPRYTPIITVNDPYTGVKTCVDSYRTKVDQMTSSLDSNSVAKSTKLIGDIKASLVDINTIAM